MQRSNIFSVSRPSMRHRGAAIFAGGLGGLIATWFKFGWDVFWPPRAAGRIPEPEMLVSMFTHHPTSLVTSHLVSFLFSILSGVAYGALVEVFPPVALGSGLAFGFAVWLGAHEFIMPWIGLTPPVWDLPANEQLAECFGHMFWGLALGVFYGYFRRRWATDEPRPPAAKASLGIPGACNVDHVGVSVPDLD